jgi:hypothetical protein
VAPQGYPPTADPTPTGPGWDPTGQQPYPGAGGGGGYPTGPTPVPGGDDGGGPNKGLVIGLIVVIVLGLAGVAFVLLGGDDDEEASTSTTTAPRSTTTEETSDTTEEPDDTTTTTEDEPDDTTTTTEDEDPPDTVDAEDVSVFDIEVGDCWNDPEAGSDTETQTVPVVPCDQPHDNEVYHLFDLTLDEYDSAAIEEEGSPICESTFEEYVGSDYDTSLLYYSAFTPTAESWEAGDREVICYLYDGTNNEPLEGSMEGAEI